MIELSESKIALRNLMLQEKKFLSQIYTEKTPETAKKLIANANANELNVLIKICLFIAKGEIPLKRKNFENIKKVKKYLDRFDNKNTVKKLLESSKEVQPKSFDQYCCIFS